MSEYDAGPGRAIAMNDRHSMDALGNRSVEWPSAVVGTALILMLGGVIVAGVLRYPNVDDALKLFGGFSAIVGVITGAFVSYFFTRGTVQQANQAAAEHAERADTEAKNAAVARKALTMTVGKLAPKDYAEIEKEPAFREALNAA